MTEDESHSSAYATIECVDSLQSFADSYEYTGKFFGKLGEIQERLDQLQDSDLPEKWNEMERKQILSSGQAYLLKYYQRFALSIERIDVANLNKIDEFSTKEFGNYLKEISEKLPDAIEDAIKNFNSVKEAVIKFHNDEIKPFKNPDDIPITNKGYLKIIRSESAHKNAIAIFNQAIDLATDIVEEYIRNENKKWDLLQEKCYEAAKDVRRMLNSSVKRYLESVIDRELSNASLNINQEWEPKELICAAAGYSSIIRKPDKDERLKRVIPQLCEVISKSGQFKIGQPIHKVKGNYVWADNSVILNYFARLLLKTRCEIEKIEYRIAKYMLFYLEETKSEESEKVQESGWCNMLTSECRHPDIDPTTDAVQALATINSMLDEQINNIVLEHFSVKLPKDIKEQGVPTLDSLFYPDYGLCLAPKKIRKNSISEVLRRMRLHVTELTLQYPDPENLYSCNRPRGLRHYSCLSIHQVCGKREGADNPNRLARQASVK